MALVSVSFVYNRYTNHAPLNFDIAFLVVSSYSCEALFSSVRGLEVVLRTFHTPNNKPRIEATNVEINIVLSIETESERLIAVPPTHSNAPINATAIAAINFLFRVRGAVDVAVITNIAYLASITVLSIIVFTISPIGKFELMSLTSVPNPT